MANELHSAQTGLDLHEPMHYAQSADPGAVGAGKWWLDTTNANAPILKRRNAGDTGWIVIAGNGIEGLYLSIGMAATIPPDRGAGNAAPGSTVVNFHHLRFPHIKGYTNAHVINGGTVSGNYDIGIYNSADGGTTLTKVTSTGSVAQGSINSFATIPLLATFTPEYGRDYWAAIQADNATGQIGRTTSSASAMTSGQDRSVANTFPLPASIAPTTNIISRFFIGFS